MPKLSRVAFSAALLTALTATRVASASTLPADVRLALARAGVPQGAVSVLVSRVASVGTASHPAQAPSRLSHRPDVPVNPASVMKLVTTYVAIDTLGPDFTWKNRVYTDGPLLAAGVLQGNLVIRGSGDPKLVIERIVDLFAQVRAKGVSEVRGDIILDRSVFSLPDSNPADFDDEPLRPYNTSPDGLLVNFKSLIFTFAPDTATQRVLVKSEPPIAGVEIPTDLALGTGACGDWRSALRADFLTPTKVSFAGRYAASCGQQQWPVAYSEPRSYAGRVLAALWRASGGTLSGSVREAATPTSAALLLAAESLPLASIVADINKFSNNVMAQQLFLSLSAQHSQGSFGASQRYVDDWWKKTLPSQPAPLIDNGSGLSRSQRTNAQALSALLQHAAASQHAAVFANSLGIAGVDGTVVRMRDRNPQSVALGNAQLKTGSLRDVAAIAGYATGRSGQRYSLVAIINHPNANAARPALDKLVEWTIQDAKSP